VHEFAGKQWSAFKETLAETAVGVLGAIGTEMQRLMADPGYVDGVLRRGAERADAIATKHLREVQDIFGFLRV